MAATFINLNILRSYFQTLDSDSSWIWFLNPNYIVGSRTLIIQLVPEPWLYSWFLNPNYIVGSWTLIIQLVPEPWLYSWFLNPDYTVGSWTLIIQLVPEPWLLVYIWFILKELVSKLLNMLFLYLSIFCTLSLYC